jgi:hypothetical protein
MGCEWRSGAIIDNRETGFDLGVGCDGRYWDRTSDLFGVNCRQPGAVKFRTRSGDVIRFCPAGLGFWRCCTLLLYRRLGLAAAVALADPPQQPTDEVCRGNLVEAAPRLWFDEHLLSEPFSVTADYGGWLPMSGGATRPDPLWCNKKTQNPGMKIGPSRSTS